MTARWLRICLLLLGSVPLVVAAGGARGARQSDLRIAYEEFRLENGLIVILHPDPTAPGVSLNLCYRVGSAHERPGGSGLAHLIEHLMFEGSANVPPGTFDRWLEEAGGQANAATSEDRTVYWQDIPPGALELALFLESDRMAFLAEGLDRSRIEHQKQVIRNERAYLYESRPFADAEWAVRPALYPSGHPYATPVIGSPEELTRLSREQVLEFHESFYHPANASLVIAGDIETEPTRDLVRKWFSRIRPGPPVRPSEIAPLVLEEDRLVVLERRVPATKLSLTWPSAATFSPDEPALLMLADLLANGPSSRLHEKLVREDRLATSVFAKQESLQAGGLFSIEVLVPPGRSLTPVLRKVDEVMKEVIKRGPSEEELGRSVAGFSTEFLSDMERVGGYDGLASRLNAYRVLTGEADFFARDLARFAGLKPRHVRAAARRWLRGGRVVLSIVPHGERRLAVATAETP